MRNEFGRRMFFRSFALKGKRTKTEWRTFLFGVTTAIGMNPVRREGPMVWTYPTADGAGGQGDTMFLPITESFLALDTWPDHDGAYLVVCSCRTFLPAALREFCRKYGLVITAEADHKMELR